MSYVTEGMFDNITKNKIKKLIDDKKYREATSSIDNSKLSSSEKNELKKYMKKSYENTPEYRQYESELKSLTKYIENEIKKIVNKINSDSTFKQKVRKMIDNAIVRDKKECKENGDEFDVDEWDDEYDGCVRNKNKVPKFICRIDPGPVDEVMFIISDDSQYIRNACVGVIDYIISELKKDKKIIESKYIKKLSSGEGDEGALFVDFNKFGTISESYTSLFESIYNQL